MIYGYTYYTIKFIWIVDGKRYVWLEHPTTKESAFIWDWASAYDFI